MSGSLGRRIAVAAVAIPLAAGVVYAGGWILVGLLALLGALGAREVYGLAARGGAQPLPGVGYVGAALFPVLAYLARSRADAMDWIVLAPAAWLLLVLGVATAIRRPDRGPIAGIGVTLLGAAYAGGLPATLIFLRYPSAGAAPWPATALAFLPLVTTWACDTCAMAGGAGFGGPKLAPTLSPAKTWSGAAAGAAGALLAAPLWGTLVVGRAGLAVSLWQLVACGAFVGTAGQFGDLAESLFKREAGVKDSGAFFPGHGGVLDRLDSLYWTVPGTALILALGGTL
ncbi:MAG: phosphatidate cytidylyltransferase [Gemmatimonadetes bacterium]|nr:phosphatidate cytidylyltransferase [Gemmatimonadota bacterium]